MPDCDGDRGNIVFWNEETQRAQPLEAQDVFALSVIAELAHLAAGGTINCQGGKPAVPPTAVAVNDPTSLRIEHIAHAFGAQVFRAEVGEANVVNLARDLRTKGYIVRILGEGSNGGNITHPAAVRDPLNTLWAILKLLVLRGEGGLFRTWCTLSGQENLFRENFTLADILRTLPAYVTTSVYEKEAMLKVSTLDHGALKGRFQALFLRDWESKKASLGSRWNLYSWEAIANNGTVQTNQLKDFSQSGKGGLKVQFYDQEGIPQGYMWMRGSGTEPVFRILADSKGADPERERFLLQWLTDMVLEADR
jgi:phosphoglucomutase